MTLEDDVSSILATIGKGEDPIYYWGLYQRKIKDAISPEDKSRFAVIKISGECLDNSLDKIADDLSVLYKLGLIPIVLHGWGKILDQRLTKAGIPIQKANGDRFTDRIVMDYVKEVARETQVSLVEALEKKGVNVTALGPENGVVLARRASAQGYGECNGRLLEINPKPIYSAINQSHLPVLLPLGTSIDRRNHYNINADDVGTALVNIIDPEKDIMVTQVGGVIVDGKIVNEVVLRRDYKTLPVEGGMKKKIRAIKLALESRVNGEDKCVQMVGPENLLPELFSHVGAGTLVRMGYEITLDPLTPEMRFLDESRIKDLIEYEFQEKGKKVSLKPGFFTETRKQVHVAKNYKGIAVVIDDPLECGVDYLDIIAVNNGFKRKGVGTDLLDSVKDFQRQKTKNGKPRLFLRCRIDREGSTHSWYQREFSGSEVYTDREGVTYKVYWTGLNIMDDHVNLLRIKEFLRNRPTNFKEVV